MPPGSVDEDDLLAILYTSGTTGQPKGATLTHRQVIANLQNIIVRRRRGVDARRRRRPKRCVGCRSASLLVVPLFHVTGCLATMTLSYATGGKLVLMPVGRFDADRGDADRSSDEKITSIGGVPTIMWRISSRRTSRSTTCRR